MDIRESDEVVENPTLTDSSRGEAIRRLAESVPLVFGIILVLLLLYLISPALSPFLIIAASLFLLYPARHQTYVRRLMWFAGIIFLLWFFGQIIGILTPFTIAFLLAYLFNPLVNMLVKKQIPRWAASMLIIVVLVGMLVLMFFLLIPIIVTQFGGITKTISDFVNDAVVMVQQGQIVDILGRFGVPEEKVKEMISQQLPSRLETLLKSLLEGTFGFLTGVTSLISRVIDIIIIPFVAFYLLKDFPFIVERARRSIPPHRREGVSMYVRKVDEVVGQYMRGVLLIAVIQGVGIALGLYVIGVKYALLLGIMSGVLNLIPIIGFYFSLVVSAIVAALSGEVDIFAKVVAVIVLYVGLNVFENAVLAPKVVGERVGLHPVVLILSLVLFGHFIGFVGLLVAVPTTAVILMSFKMWRERSQEKLEASTG